VTRGCFALLFFLLPLAAPGQKPGPLADEPLVDLAMADPTIVIDLRYATDRNVTGKPIYSSSMPCLVRRGVAERLKIVSAYLRARGFRLKIWDGYRPLPAQRALFGASKRNADYVADPGKGLALHTWGVAVDASVVDANGRDVRMPTDFDEFSPAATMFYKGGDPLVAKHLAVLQRAMGAGGFYGLREEWWHFIAKDWANYGPVSEPLRPVAGGLKPSSATGSAARADAPPTFRETRVAEMR
jgi:D-alanyl-D-alanine dipeptidase